MSRVAVAAFALACGVGWMDRGECLAASPPNVIVFYTDDHGHADLGVQGVVDDIRTPHTDALARAGARMVHGYSTAPQCVPSRAGLLSGRFQSRFGVEDNLASLTGFDREPILPKRLAAAGYVTAQFGKWHLGPPDQIERHGFRHVFAQNANRPFQANVTMAGEDRPLGLLADEAYHVDGCSRAAAALIRRYRDQPFFLYIAYRAPHVPLDAPARYLDRFPGPMPERRRQALAMLSAVDDGVGLITRTLAGEGLTERTLIFYISDNGAPLKLHKLDEPGGGPGWDGSLNDPLNGEKGMLSEGGIHVPFLVAWPGTIPAGQVFTHPVTTLDVAATVLANAGFETAPGELDGVDLIPHLTGADSRPPHDWIAWRWNAQAAIRAGDWKLLRGGDREYLYHLGEDLEEQHNRAKDHPEIADRLREQLNRWTEELEPPGLAVAKMSPVWLTYFDHYLEGRRVPPPGQAASKGTPADPTGDQDWIARGGQLDRLAGVLRYRPGASVGGFLTRAGLNLPGPLRLRMTLTPEGEAGGNGAAPGRVAWRIAGDKEFLPQRSVDFAFPTRLADGTFPPLIVDVPAEGSVIHMRIHLPNRPVEFAAIEFEPIRPEPAADPGTRDNGEPPGEEPAISQAAPATPERRAEDSTQTANASPDRPLNVVLILADDLGWSDTAWMGTSRLYPTPNLRRLADRGMLFTNAYSASPLCSPTRASILTGQNPARTGITAPNCHLPEVRLQPTRRETAAVNSATLPIDSVTRLDAERVSLATRLRDAGYATGHFGKWHLGHVPYSPLQHGFDIDIPHHPGPGPAGSFVAPWKFRDFVARTPGEHIEDRMGDEAVAWIEQHRDRPFFLNYWQFSVHAPFDAKPELIEAYRSRIDPEDEQRSPTYAAMVHSLDDNVGKLLDALDRLGLADQTAVIFFSDNGGNMYDQIDGTTPTSNRPLRGGKGTLHEGGIRVPAAIVWPGVTAAASRSDARIQSTDLYPTLLSLLGLAPTPDHPLDGVDLTPALRGEPFDRGPMFTYFPHQVRVPDHLPPGISVHRDGWKLIRLFHVGEPSATEPTDHAGATGRPHGYRLYHLDEDLGEHRNRAAEHPELVRDLDREIDRFLAETGALVPIPNPRYDPSAPGPAPRGAAIAAANRPAGGPNRVGPWNLSGDTRLSRDGARWKVVSAGGDPWLATNDLPADWKGPFRVRLDIRSTAAGPAMVYYRGAQHPRFHRDQTVPFALRHDGTWQVHEVELPIADLVAVRLDPATAPGEIEIREFQLLDATGQTHSLLP